MIWLLSLAIAAGLFASAFLATLAWWAPKVSRIDGRLLRDDDRTIEHLPPDEKHRLGKKWEGFDGRRRTRTDYGYRRITKPKKAININKIKAIWRKGWDSNPRWACTHGGFQDRCLKPLGHPSSRRVRPARSVTRSLPKNPDGDLGEVLIISVIASQSGRQSRPDWLAMTVIKRRNNQVTTLEHFPFKLN